MHLFPSKFPVSVLSFIFLMPIISLTLFSEIVIAIPACTCVDDSTPTHPIFQLFLSVCISILLFWFVLVYRVGRLSNTILTFFYQLFGASLVVPFLSSLSIRFPSSSLYFHTLLLCKLFYNLFLALYPFFFPFSVNCFIFFCIYNSCSINSLFDAIPFRAFTFFLSILEPIFVAFFTCTSVFHSC